MSSCIIGMSSSWSVSVMNFVVFGQVVCCV